MNLPNIISRFSFTCFAVTFVLVTSAQEKTDHQKFLAALNEKKKFYSSKLNMEFTPLNNWKCLSGDVLNFSTVNKPIILLI